MSWFLSFTFLGGEAFLTSGFLVIVGIFYSLGVLFLGIYNGELLLLYIV